MSDAAALTFAVRCRDQLHLPVPAAVDVPPRTVTPRGPSASVPEPDVAEQWLTWWRRLVDRTFECVYRPTPADGAWPGGRVVTVSDAVDLIESGPLLRYAATVADLPVDAAPAGPAPVMPLNVVHDAVEETAQRNSVPVNELQGAVHLLPGSTLWRAVVRPGYGLMMLTGPIRNDDALHRFICEVLESGLHGRTR
ncbi:MAG: hypothetical protein ACXVXC_10670 [Nocardioidaceae bacterium]